MKKYILPILAVLVILFFAFAIYNYTKENSHPLLNANSVNNINDKNTIPINNTTKNIDKKADDSGTKDTGASGISNKESGGGNSNESSCALIRPGNLPDVNCFVNYIKKDSISLKIENKLGEDIGIIIDLKSCSPKIQNSINNNQEKDFVFSCNNNDYFNQDILITYILQQNKTVNIGGFVNGPVED